MKVTTRAALTACGIAAVLTSGSSLAVAAAAEPTVSIAATAGKVTVSGAKALKQGPTSFHFSGTGKGGKEIDLVVFRLKPGATTAQVLGAAAKLKGPPTPLEKYGTFLIGSSTTPATPSYTAGVSLTRGTYLVIDSTTAPKLAGSFSVTGATSGAAAAKPTATITLSDFKIAAPATLPSSGIIRFTNRGMSPHFVAFIRTASMADAMKGAALLRQGKDSKAHALLVSDSSVLGLISPGVTNDVVVSGLKPGTYVLACFYGDARSKNKEHTMLGMETVATVR